MNAARQSPERWSPPRTKPRAPVGARLQSRDSGKLFFPPFIYTGSTPHCSQLSYFTQLRPILPCSPPAAARIGRALG